MRGYALVVGEDTLVHDPETGRPWEPLELMRRASSAQEPDVYAAYLDELLAFFVKDGALWVATTDRIYLVISTAHPVEREWAEEIGYDYQKLLLLFDPSNPRPLAWGEGFRVGWDKKSKMMQPAWWLVSEGRALAGPFSTKDDTYQTMPPEGETWEHLDVETVYGVLCPGGQVKVRQSPEEKAFEAYLSEQLDHVTDGLGTPLALHPHGDLARAIATALVESGFVLHDCVRRAVTGGVCVTPSTEGVIVAWTQHDRQARDHVRGYDVYSEVQDTMNYAVADVLRVLGFQVEPFGQASAHIVTGQASASLPR